jgi:hypothetical protein
MTRISRVAITIPGCLYVFSVCSMKLAAHLPMYFIWYTPRIYLRMGIYYVFYNVSCSGFYFYLCFNKKFCDFLCLVSTICKNGPPLLSSGQRSWLKIQRSGFDSRRYQIFFSEKGWVWNGVQAVGIRCADHATPSIRKSWH